MFKNGNQNKANLSQLVNCAKTTPVFITFLVCGFSLFYYLSDTFVIDFMPFFAMTSGLIYGLLISSKRDMSKKENCYSYKGNLTESLIILHKFGFELAQESKNYIRLDLKRLFAKPKSIFLIQGMNEIKILGESELIEAMKKDLPKCAINNVEQKT